MNINKLLSNPEHILYELVKDDFKLAKELWGEKVYTYYYDCTRSWEAWQYNTMDQDDFEAIELAEYQYHLQQLIISPDCEAYIRENTKHIL